MDYRLAPMRAITKIDRMPETVALLKSIGTRQVNYLVRKPVTYIGLTISSAEKCRDIISSIENHYGITLEEMKDRSRRSEVVNVRQALMYCLKEKTPMGLSQIGKILGFDHATVLHAHRKISGLIEVNDIIAMEIKRLCDTL